MNIINRLKNVMPGHIQPIANNIVEHIAAMEKISQERIKRDETRAKQERIQYLMGYSGISPLHRDCSFDNYHVSTDEQKLARDKAIEFVNKFGCGFGSFIFSGLCGTGKNHLTAAICHGLIAKGKNVLCITVPDLMMKLRATYSKHSVLSEEILLKELFRVDLLVLDEIGIQHRNSENTDIIINQIVDHRTSHKKPLGMLTNLNYEEMTTVLGARVIDRMMMDNGLWVNFNWKSYRSKVRHAS